MRTRFVVVTVIVPGAAAVAALLFIRPGGFSARVSPSAPERLLATAVRGLAVPRSGREALNPRSPSELEEERQDKDFLEGNEPDTTPSTRSHHVHKE